MPDWTGYNLPVAPGDTTFEIGGYEGKWAEYIAKTYNPWQHVFEPAPRAYDVMKKRLVKYPKVMTYNFGLGCRDAILNLGDSDRDGAGFYKSEKPVVRAEIVDIERFIQEKGIGDIKIARVNIEGGEYELIPYMVGTGVIRQVHYLFIQWHYIASIPGAGPTRVAMDTLLRRSHRMVSPSPLRNWGMWERLETCRERE